MWLVAYTKKPPGNVCLPNGMSFSRSDNSQKILSVLFILIGKIRIKRSCNDLLEFPGDIDPSWSKYKDVIADLVKSSLKCAAAAGCKIEKPLGNIKIQSFKIQDHNTS